MSDDDLPELPPKPDWHRGDKGIWTTRLADGRHAHVEYGDHPNPTKKFPTKVALETWRATIVTFKGTIYSKPFKSFNQCIAWAEKELFPPRTAWDRIRAV